MVGVFVELAAFAHVARAERVYCKDLDCLELFAGDANVTSALRKKNLMCAKYDLRHNARSMNFCSSSGFALRPETVRSDQALASARQICHASSAANTDSHCAKAGATNGEEIATSVAGCDGTSLLELGVCVSQHQRQIQTTSIGQRERSSHENWEPHDCEAMVAQCFAATSRQCMNLAYSANTTYEHATGRVALLAMVLNAMGCTFIVEQPVSSLMEYHPRWQELCQTCKDRALDVHDCEASTGSVCACAQGLHVQP